MSSYIILSEKKWHFKLYEKLNNSFDDKWILINDKEKFTIENISLINPKKIFIPHWSYKIESQIYNKFECILFHMTDLPYGRGGSPLQNLIIRGHKATKISAIRVVEKVDSGPIYHKKELKLSGSARDIFDRSLEIIFDMIKFIINKNPQPRKQLGKITYFKRRNPSESSLSQINNIEAFYDQIRMLDADGYPKSFIELNGFQIEFSKAEINNKIIKANVRIFKK